MEIQQNHKKNHLIQRKPERRGKEIKNREAGEGKDNGNFSNSVSKLKKKTIQMYYKQLNAINLKN